MREEDRVCDRDLERLGVILWCYLVWCQVWWRTVTAGKTATTAYLIVEDKQWNVQKTLEPPAKPQYHLSDSAGSQVKRGYILFDPLYATSEGKPDVDKLIELARSETLSYSTWQAKEVISWKARIL